MTGDSERSEESPDGQNGGLEQISTVERVTMVASVLFTVALFAFAVWQVFASPPTVVPQAQVIDTAPGPEGSVATTVELRSSSDAGLLSVTVAVNCTTPPPTITFENVPADARREGTVVCPAGTTAPNATVETWIAE